MSLPSGYKCLEDVEAELAELGFTRKVHLHGDIAYEHETLRKLDVRLNWPNGSWRVVRDGFQIADGKSVADLDVVVRHVRRLDDVDHAEQICWIDVEDKLPDSGSLVLVCYDRTDCTDRDITIAGYDESYEEEGESPWEVEGGLCFDRVLYWAEMPIGPKG